MTNYKFNKLRVGDNVTLAVMRPEYSCGHRTSDGRIYIPAGTTGVVGAVRVPAVRGRERYFVCVDFPRTTGLIDRKGKAATHWGQAKMDEHNDTFPFRCAAVAAELV